VVIDPETLEIDGEATEKRRKAMQKA